MENKILEKYEKMLIKEGILKEGAATLTKIHFNTLALAMKSSKTLDELKEKLVAWAGALNPMFDANKFRQVAGMK